MDSVKAFLHEWRVVLLMIHVGVTAAMIVVILLQRSEGGGLGMGRTDALFSVRGQANVLSRATAIFAGIFFFLSLLMAWSVGTPVSTRSIMDNVPTGSTAPPSTGGTTAPAPGAPAPGAPSTGAPATGTPPAPATPGAPTAPTR
jgi:preprotein translocase subunit SecG